MVLLQQADGVRRLPMSGIWHKKLRAKEKLEGGRTFVLSSATELGRTILARRAETLPVDEDRRKKDPPSAGLSEI